MRFLESHGIAEFPARKITIAVLCLGQDFLGTQVSLYLNFRGTFTNSGGQTKSFKFLPVKLNSYPEISVHFYLNLSSMSIDLAQEGL